MDDVIRLLTIDLISPYALLQAAGRHTGEQGRGAIVTTTSAAQQQRAPQSSSYHVATSVGEPQGSANAALFLVSDEARFTTGAVS